MNKQRFAIALGIGAVVSLASCFALGGAWLLVVFSMPILAASAYLMERHKSKKEKEARA